jgi:hypothetical protein
MNDMAVMIWNDEDIADLRRDLRKRGIPRDHWDVIIEEAQELGSDAEVTDYLDRIERDRLWF